jgi:hypothetical protein
MSCYKANFLKVLFDLSLVNFVIIVLCVFRNTSTESIIEFAAFLNFVMCLFIILKKDVIKICIKSNSIILYLFRFRYQPKLKEVELRSLTATYLYENVGKGIRQRKLRLFEGDEEIALLDPSFTGWSHTALDEIVTGLLEKGIIVEQ